MYAVIKNVNGSFAVDSEWTDENMAVYKYHTVCATLWNAPEAVSAEVKLVDAHLDTVKGYHDIIIHGAKA